MNETNQKSAGFLTVGKPGTFIFTNPKHFTEMIYSSSA